MTGSRPEVLARAAGVLGEVVLRRPAPALQQALAHAAGPTEHAIHWVERDGRPVDYHLYLTTVREPSCT